MDQYVLSYEEAVEYRKILEEYVASGKLTNLANQILTKKNAANQLNPENIAQEFAYNFVRPKKNQQTKQYVELHKLRMYDPNRAKFDSFIYQCMQNMIITMLERRNKQVDTISYNNLIDNDDQNEGSFANFMIANNDLPVTEADLSDIINNFKTTLNDFELFVFDNILLSKVKPKELLNKAKKNELIENPKRMYTRILKIRQVVARKFIDFINSSEYLTEILPEGLSRTLV